MRPCSSVYVWGNGNAGQLGLGDLNKAGLMQKYDELIPRRLDTLPLEAGETVTQVGTGSPPLPVDACSRDNPPPPSECRATASA